MGSDELGRDLRLSGGWVGEVEGPWVKSASLILHLELSDGRFVDVRTDPVTIDERDVKKRTASMGAAGGLRGSALILMTIDMVMSTLGPRISQMKEQAIQAILDESKSTREIKSALAKAKRSNTDGAKKIAEWLEELLKRRGHK